MPKTTPMYIQIHDKIKQKIEDGEWSIGDRLPSERDLSEEFEVSRMTLRQAIQTLSDEGILEKRIGSGTFVASKRVQEKMSGTTSFTEIMMNQGKTPSSKTIAYYLATPSKSESEKLQLLTGEEVLRMERVRYADNIPICFEVAAIPAKIVKYFSKQEVTAHFYQTLSEHGYEIGGSEQTISATIARDKIADLLSIKKGTAILRLRQLSFLSDKKPFEYVRTQYVGERFEFYLEK